MFGIGLPEMVIIAIVALIFIGPDKLPGVLRSIGKGLVALKRATSDVRSTVQEEMQKIEDEIEIKEVRESAQDFKNELGGVANKIDPLTLSKFNSKDQNEVFPNSEKNMAQTDMVTDDEIIDDKVKIEKQEAFSTNDESFENPRAEKS